VTKPRANTDQALQTGRIAYGLGTDDHVYPLDAGAWGKTIQTPLLAASAIAASVIVKSSEINLMGAKKATFFIDHGRASTVAWGALGGTTYLIQVSEKDTGNDTWVAYTTMQASSAVCASALSSGAVTAAQTSIVILSGTAFVAGQYIMWANTADAANSTEWAQVTTVTGTASFTVLDPMTNAQGSTVVITNNAQHWAATLDCSSFTRARVVIDNTTGTTGIVRSRVACITG
jgi:hypothetical protein